MKKLKVFLIAVLMASGLSAQNLVNNGDFSVMATNSPCLLGTGFDKGRPDDWWDKTTNPSLLPRSESPDYYHTCSPVGQRHPSNNARGCADPKSGTAYVGFLAWLKNHPDVSSEYIYHELATALTINQTYNIEFWVSAADNADYNYFVASLGMYLTNNVNDFISGQGPGYHNLAPSVQIPNTFPATNYYTTTNGWQKISGTYKPTVTGVKHILIGNFDPGIAAYDAITNPNSPNIQHRPGTVTGPGETSYYFIDAVSIKPVGQSIPNYDPVISGPNAICFSGSTYTLSNIPPTASVTWTASPSNLITPSSGTGTTANISAVNHNPSQGSITFQINGICDQSSKSQNLTIGHPSEISGSLSGPSTVSISQVAWYSVPSQSQADGTFYWTLPSGFSITSQGNNYRQVQVWIQNGASSGYVQVWKTNNCGNGGAKFKYVTVNGGGGGCPKCVNELIATPNPVVHELDIKYADKTTGIILDYDEFESRVEYVVTDLYGNVVFSKSSKKTRDKLNLSSIRKGGTYILSAYYGEDLGVEQVRIILER